MPSWFSNNLVQVETAVLFYFPSLFIFVVLKVLPLLDFFASVYRTLCMWHLVSSNCSLPLK